MDDADRGVAFYRDVFSCQITEWDGPHAVLAGQDRRRGYTGIDGGLTMRQQPGASTVNVIGVDSVDDTTARVTASGGSVVTPKMHIPGGGRIAYYRDTEGNVVGVIRSE